KDRDLADSIAEAALKKVEEKYNVELMANNTLLVYKDALSNFKILIIKLSSIGDVVLSTAAFKAIRQKFPEGYKISVLTGEESKDILLRCPYIDELLVCDLKGKDKGVKGIFKIAQQLRKKGFDKVVDLQNNRASHILAYLSLATDRYGYDNGKFSFLINHRIKDNLPPAEPVTHQFRVLKMLGIDLDNPALELWPSEKDNAYAEEFLSSEWISDRQKLIGINISASKRWTTKNLPLFNLVRLCEKLGERDMRVVITGTADDLKTAEDLISKAKNTKIINACGKTTINQLAALIKKCSCYICGDSAPLHVASAVGAPFIALFGPTDSRRHMPPARNFVLIKKELPCSPCYKSKCKKNDCMALITPDEIMEAVDRLIT
ncbi:MAG: lipopolysaccharide heptosyltransferase II, partial [Candidatus Omnitrophica bacterium]|nr:lipopolysaccharide heptosyltransferase II [Candidatus Omnitrophota bacterium]